MNMINSEQIHTTLLNTLRQVVPQIDPQTLQPDLALHEQLHLDSIDFLRLILALEQEFHLTIFEFDYPQLSTLDGCEHYLTDQLALGPPLLWITPGRATHPASDIAAKSASPGERRLEAVIWLPNPSGGSIGAFPGDCQSGSVERKGALL